MHKPLYEQTNQAVADIIRQVFDTHRMLSDVDGTSVFGMVLVREEFTASPELAAVLTERTLRGEHMEWTEYRNPQRPGLVSMNLFHAWGQCAAKRERFSLRAPPQE